MRYQFVSIDTIFSKLIRDSGLEFNEGNVIEWCGEALEAIGCQKFYRPYVAFIEVSNHQCDLPKGIHSIIQIGRDRLYNEFYSDAADQFCPKKIYEDVCPQTKSPYIKTDAQSRCLCPDATDPLTPDYLFLDCNGMPLNDYDIAYYRPYFDLRYEYYGSSNYGIDQRYTPVTLSSSSFSSLVATHEHQKQLNQEAHDNYTIIEDQALRFSFEKGLVAVAYEKQILSPITGYPMIPDDYSYKTAITKYIIMMIKNRECYMGRAGACQLADKLALDWQWYCGQASNKEKMPHGIDEWQRITSQRNRMIPVTNAYFGFFNNVSQPENRRWGNRVR